jgi:hypothetical protein
VFCANKVTVCLLLHVLHFQGSLKVIYLSDSIRSRLLSWFGSLIIKKILEYHPPNVYGYVEIQMLIVSRNSTIPNVTIFDFCNEDRIYRHYIAT